MPSKFRKAIGAWKDQTSIRLAKVSNTNASTIEVLILKATRHDEVPIDERYVNELLNLISSNKVHAAACAHVIGKRIGKTRNWIVALKSLILVLRIFQDGDPYFPKEVLHSMKRGAKILNLSNFRDDSKSSPWDYTAYIRTFARYLNERLDCFLTGKLQRRFTNREREHSYPRRSQRGNDSVSQMKPAMLLDKISHWQKLLDRAVGTRPTGAAKTNRLVQISLYAVVKESFGLYRDISDGLALLLDSFFHLPYECCVSAYQTCVKASKQYEELSSFYDLCKSIGVGRSSEYPSVQKVSEELVETLQEFLKDHSSFPANGRPSTNLLLLPAPAAKDASLGYDGSHDQASEPSERFSERGSEFGSQCTSLEDLMSTTDGGTSPSTSMDQYYLEHLARQSQTEDRLNAVDSGSINSLNTDQRTTSAANSILDFVSLDDWPSEDPQEQEGQQNSTLDSNISETDRWELVLAEAANQSMQASPQNGFESPNGLSELFDQDFANVPNGFESPIANDFFDQPSLSDHQYNPFLQDTTEIPAITATVDNSAAFPADRIFSVAPTFQTTLTFSAPYPDTTMGLHTGATDNKAEIPANDMFSVTPTFQPTSTFPVKDVFSDAPTFQATPNFRVQNPDTVMVLHSTATTDNKPEFPANHMFSVAPTFQATPTFSAQNPDTAMGLHNEDDPFAPCLATIVGGHKSTPSMDQQNLLLQQQLWLQNQDKIIAKNLS